MATLTATITNYLYTQPNTSTASNTVKVAILQLNDSKAEAVQNQECVKAGIAVQRYGIWLLPMTVFDNAVTIKARKDGKTFTASTDDLESDIGSTITFNEEV